VLAWNEPRLTQYPASLAITWLTSFEQLGEAARPLLRRLAWLSPAPIPESLLEVAIAGEAPNPGGAFDALVELEGLSLLNRSGEAHQFVVHRLVQEVTRLRQELAQEPHELQAALAWIDAAFVGDPQDVRSWPVLEPLESHAKAVSNFAAGAGAGAGVAGVTARLLNQLGLLLLTKAAYSEAEPLMRRTLAIAEYSYGQDHPKVAIGLNNLAQLLKATNRLAEAEPLMRRGLTIEERTNGINPPNVAIRLNNLAVLLQDTNRLAEAEPMYRLALAFSEASYGQDHPNLARDLNNLAVLLMDTNRVEEAELLMRRALQIDEGCYGLDHPAVAGDLNNLAQLLGATNRLTDAEPLMRRALQIDEASYGLDHPEVARDLNNLAQLLRATNRLSEAEQMYCRCLQILITSMQNQVYQHPELETVINNYIDFLHAQGL
jgi:tetratricopeptide (TPR) repeat protein